MVNKTWIYYLQIVISKLYDSVYNGIGNEPHRIENIEENNPRQITKMNFNEDNIEDFLSTFYLDKTENEWTIINPELRLTLKKNLVYKSPQKTFLSRIVGDIKMIQKPPKQIINNLWLGNAFDSANYDFIKKQSIKAIINITCEVPNFFINDGVEYLNIIVRDEKGAMINEETFEKSSLFINRFIEKDKPVFVHCFVGRSRSVAIICYYLIKYKNIPFKDAYNMIKQNREFAQLNSNFAEILSNYDEST